MNTDHVSIDKVFFASEQLFRMLESAIKLILILNPRRLKQTPFQMAIATT